MTIQEVNNIFQTKYSNGIIFQRGSYGGSSKNSISVMFKKNGKVYDYQVQNYVELLNKLGFKVLYQKNVIEMKRQIAELEKELKAGGRENILFKCFVPLSDQRKNEYLQIIQSYKEDIENSIIVAE